LRTDVKGVYIILWIFSAACVILRYIESMSDELLTVEQAAQKLQMHVATVRRMLRSGQLAGMKIGLKEWRIPDKAIQALTDASMLSKPVAPKGE